MSNYSCGLHFVLVSITQHEQTDTLLPFCQRIPARKLEALFSLTFSTRPAVWDTPVCPARGHQSVLLVPTAWQSVTRKQELTIMILPSDTYSSFKLLRKLTYACRWAGRCFLWLTFSTRPVAWDTPICPVVSTRGQLRSNTFVSGSAIKSVHLVPAAWQSVTKTGTHHHDNYSHLIHIPPSSHSAN